MSTLFFVIYISKLRMSSPIDISIIIPCKDEAQRLPRFLQTITDHCSTSAKRYEIIVVDDGSSDGTSQSTEKFRRQFPALTVLRFETNHGKGFAVKQGLLAAKGGIALFLDADGSTPVTEIERHLHYFNDGYDIVIGSRVLQDDQSSVQALAYRKWMGAVFNGLVHLLLIKNIKDTQCGFKMFRSAIVRPLFEQVRLDGFGFDLEVLFLAQKMDYKIKEVAVNWAHVDGSKINMAKDSLKMFINILQIRQWHRRKNPGRETQNAGQRT